MNISDTIADKLATFEVQLSRFDAGIREDVLDILAEVERDIVGLLAKRDPSRIDRPTFRERRLQRLLAEIKREVTIPGYRKINGTVQRGLAKMAGVSAEVARDTVNKSLGGTGIITIGVSQEQLRQIARDTLIEGSPAREWWAGQEASLRDSFLTQMRRGLVMGDNLDGLVRRVRGTRGGGFEDGIMQTSRRNAEALVRTSVMAVNNASRLESYRANPDVIRGVQALVTLDSRTTIICLALGEGAMWDLEGNPLPESTYQGPMPGDGPPFHWGCRTTLIAVLRTAADMLRRSGIQKRSQIKSMSPTMRAGLDGKPAAPLTTTQWLKNRAGDGTIDTVLGKTRANLWRAGKLKPQQLIDQTGRPLSLDGLKRSVRGITEAAVEKAQAA